MPLITRTNYNERGEAFEMIDAAGKVSRTYADHAGRTVRTIQNYVPSDPNIANPCFCPGVEQNVTVDREYGPGGQMTALIARNPVTGDQVTRYQYGVTLTDSDVASSDLLRSETYPDAADTTDRVFYSYNRQGQRKRTRDQNGSIHDYTFDALGRQTADTVTTLANGIDGTVRRIGTSYEVRGLVEKITSYGDTTGTSVVNEVQNVYNSFSQLTTQYQEPNGAVNTGTSAKVQYTYADGSTNTIRPETLIYPSGTVLEYKYDDTAAE